MKYGTKIRLKTFTVSCVRDGVAATVDGSDAAADVLRRIVQDYDKEHFVLLARNVRGKLNGFKVISVGSMTTCLVHMREVFRAAITLGAASIVVAHNHPSGDTAPSDEDTALTARLVQGGELLGIPVMDHIVFTENSYQSII